MQRAGFRQLDLQIEREIFHRAPTAHTPAYSSERRMAERVVNRLQELHPGWRQEMAEDHWGYTSSWHCPWPQGTSRSVLVAEYRSPMLAVAVCRAALHAHRNYERYERRRLAREPGMRDLSPGASARDPHSLPIQPRPPARRAES